MVSIILGFGWVIPKEELEETFPKHEEDSVYFLPLSSKEEVLFGVSFAKFTDGKMNIAEVITNFIENAEPVAEELAAVLRKNGVSWDARSKWYNPQVYLLEVNDPANL